MRSLNCRAGTERGAVLIIVLVMVGIFMVIITSLVTTSSLNFRIAGNQQYRMEAKVAAKNALEGYISNDANFQIPLPTTNSVFYFNFDGDVNGNTGDDINDMSASVAPPICTASLPIANGDLNPVLERDRGCLGLIEGQEGIIGESGPSAIEDSWCTNMNWQVSASVSDANTGAALDMTQGFAVRALIGTPCSS